jgi:hypothetical protein
MMVDGFEPLDGPKPRPNQKKSISNGAGPLKNGFGTFVTNDTPPAGQQLWDPLDLSLLGTGRTRPPQFPTALLGSFWERWCVDNAHAKSCPVDYVIATLLAAAASLLGNARRPSPHTKWKEPAHLWVGLVGSPSSGKTSGMAPVLEIISKFNRASVEETKQRQLEHKKTCEEAEVNRAAWRDSHKAAVKNGTVPPAMPENAVEPEFREAPRFIVTDVTPERLGGISASSPKGVLSVRDELAGWIGNFDRYSGGGGGERAMWLEAYNGGHHCIDRQKSPVPIVVDHFSVGIVGGIQPDKLSLISGGSDDGLASRFIWFWPEDIPDFRIEERHTDEEAAAQALRRLRDVAMLPADAGSHFPGRVPLSPAAVKILEEYGQHLRQIKVVGPLAGMIGKGIGTVLRLAHVLEWLWWSAAPAESETPAGPRELSDAALNAACGLFEDYFTPQGRRVFGEASIPEVERNAMRLARWLADNRSLVFNARQAGRKILGPLRDAKTMAAACEFLIGAGWIRPRHSPNSGRPRSDFDVNPAVFEGPT